MILLKTWTDDLRNYGRVGGLRSVGREGVVGIKGVCPSWYFLVGRRRSFHQEIYLSDLISKMDTVIEILGAESRTRDTIDRYRKMLFNIKANGNGSGTSGPESSS